MEKKKFQMIIRNYCPLKKRLLSHFMNMVLVLLQSKITKIKYPQ